MLAERVPPQDVEAERACLGAALIDPEALEVLAEALSPADFYVDRHRLIFETMLAIRPRVVDLITVTDELKRRGKLEEAGGITYLSQLARLVPTTANVSAYAEIVAHKARCRRAQDRLRQIVERLYDATPADLEDLAFAASIAVEEPPGQEFEDVRLLGDVAVERVKAMRQRRPGELLGTTWGFRVLDYATPGLEPGALYVIAGRPGMGKTGLGLEVVRRNATATRKPWLVVTLEMALEALADRLITAGAHLNGSAYRRATLSQAEWDLAQLAAEGLRSIPLYATSDCVTVEDVRRRARYLREQQGDLGGILVDYLQLMSGGRRRRDQSRQEEVADISRSLKRLAIEFECPVIALAQLNRAVEQRNDKRPQLSDLRESGAIEADAEAVLLLYRQDYYDAMDGKPVKEHSTVEVIIAKQRNGPVVTVELSFHPAWALWTDLERKYDEKQKGA